ncbi:TPA: BglG family transcription antiterminator [Streptococcus suis]|uniref:BglG family transcription antiterminator n=1 Tax=Streptococcus TaxID=1301 RepID=UPI001C8E644E|nr:MULTISPECIES: PRD domain-containing protein [Streptococcus]MBY0719969.1 BglG family transcription antiterminator [Streptococcus sp. 2018110]MCO8206945.1 BglG family transcription antiterminator [Streptococcus suis]MCO8211433.1 BglG family transcription antiterminator [Streptococcus suis]MCO8235507.1 BglG family transcription antiterminator [Streptococcus suis]HEM3491741.1 BglG family transcription antiterminator [Streptococcus suis]
MLSQKERQILHYLIEKRDSYTTSKELADYLSCSDRTVRTYLKQLIHYLETLSDSGASICSKQGYGYRLEISNNSVLQQLLQETNSSLNDSHDRYNYILNKLLFEQEEVYFDDLAEELFVSRSTLSHEFKKIRQDLDRYHLVIESKANKGVYISGDERDKRRFIMDYFFRDNFFKSMHNYIDGDVTQSIISLEELTLIVLDECREAELKLSDFVIQNLVVHIALALRRIQEGFRMAPIEELNSELYQTEQETARKILQRIDKATGISCPKEEADYITLHFVSKGSATTKGERGDDSQQLRQELVRVLETSPSAEEYQFQQDSQLLEGVITHLTTMLVRLQTKVHLENPLRDEIRQQYARVFDMTRKIVQEMPIFSNYLISDDEVAYVALHFMAAMERLKEKQKYRILVICATGYGSAQLLRNRIERELGNTVHIEDVIGYYDLNDERLENIDFIISSIDLSNLVFSIPVFTVSVFFTADEARQIKQSVKQMRFLARPSRQFEPKHPRDMERLFEDYFSETCFIRLDEGNKSQVLGQLAQALSQGEDAGFSQLLLEYMAQREQMSSVVFSNSIAVPHPIKPIAKQHRIAVAILPAGLTWDQHVDNIRLVFLPSPSIYENEGMGQLTSQIVELLEEEDLQEAMIACHSFAEFRELFLKIGRRR